jgi:hypothetical protein
MAHFEIDGTNFGVDANESRFDLDRTNVGDPLLTVEVRGDEDEYERITNDDSSPWSWTLYPPHFYLRGYPVPASAGIEKTTIHLRPEDADDYDVALYMMEHNAVDDVEIVVSDATRIEISGRVELDGKFVPFAIGLSKNA